ncbi:uncharacterized protein LY79DRAFT_614449 [Colletotrichum navitas]|uniref:Azaphilone pigments biosynthesis cluster protein L N-terminal domain-containing protein n=1 Tax=Colletotrichum navitas TaxID=681940 RepID=A0AAD8V1Q2_9PEZI|nr:uncharacterized protein LY79DRAFT_614449 [Colletotrichum navitas]KAK1574575.1 hypothetical protein LY79DRAFT_614449 [Colletotrichum navitas]
MSDPLSVASALVAIVTATMQSGKILYDTIQSFKNHRKVIRELVEELAALNEVLLSLNTLVQKGEDRGSLRSLKVPLLQCRQACDDFNGLIIECSKNSGRPRTSFRDWFKVRYMESDIGGFVTMLAGYKSTISIALGSANLESATVTLQTLNEYKDMIQKTAGELEDHLEDINAKLEHLILHQQESFQALSSNIDRIQNEKDSTEICLEICAQVQARIDEMQFRPISPSSSSNEISCRNLTRAMVMTMSTLSQCRDIITDNVSQLRRQKEEVSRQQLGSDVTSSSGQLEAGNRRLQEEANSTKTCLTICNDASEHAMKRVHVLEDMTTGHDGQQLFVSTLGDLFNVKGATTGDRGIQFVGSVGEESLQEFFRSQMKW